MTYTFTDMSRDSRRSLAARRTRRWQRLAARALGFITLWSILAVVTVATATATYA